MADLTFDVVIVGSGPGGYVAAVRAAQLGKRVACVERAELGGICLNWGCIPTKTLINDAHFFHEMMTQAPKFGLTVDPAKLAWGKIVERSRAVAGQLSKGIEFLFKKGKVQTFKGTAFVATPNAVEVKDAAGKVETLVTEHVLICTGARPRELPGVKPDGKRILTSREAMILPEIPQRLCIIGAGAIGVEFAYIYHQFGTKVTLVEMLPNILPVEDGEVSGRLKTIFQRQGMDIRTRTRTDKVEVVSGQSSVVSSSPPSTPPEGGTPNVPPSGGAVRVAVTDLATNTPAVIEADQVLVAIGVRANVEGLFGPGATPALEKGGGEGGGWIKVGKDFQTSVPGIYAAGDVIGPPWLAHVASFEATIAVERMFGVNHREMDYTIVPGGTYCHPQVASVGLTEQQCKEQGLAYEVGKYAFAASGKALAINAPEGFVKLIFGKPHGELLGAHILGADATEMIAELVLAKRLEATKEEIYSTIHAHPTLSEAVMDAAAAIGER